MQEHKFYTLTRFFQDSGCCETFDVNWRAHWNSIQYIHIDYFNNRLFIDWHLFISFVNNDPLDNVSLGAICHSSQGSLNHTYRPLYMWCWIWTKSCSNDIEFIFPKTSLGTRGCVPSIAPLSGDVPAVFLRISLGWKGKRRMKYEGQKRGWPTTLPIQGVGRGKAVEAHGWTDPVNVLSWYFHRKLRT